MLKWVRTAKVATAKMAGACQNGSFTPRLPCDPLLLHPQNKSRPNLPSFQAAKAPKTAPEASEAEIRQIIEREMIRSLYVKQRASNG